MGREPRILYCNQHSSLSGITSRIYAVLAGGAMARRAKRQLAKDFLTWRKAHKSSLRCLPTLINIELTNYCNHKCKFCSTGLGVNSRPKGKMDLETFTLISNQILPGTAIVFAGFGEPFLNTDLELFLERANSRNLTSYLQILSNFGAISEARIRGLLDYPFQRLVISLDSMSRETFKQYRGCDDFDNVFNNITILADEIKKRKYITQEVILQMVVTKKNISEKEHFIDVTKKMNLIPRLKQLNTHNSFAGEPHIKEFEVPELSRYSEGGYSRTCEWVWGGMMVLWNGDVTICCQDALGIEAYGNVKNDSIVDLLNRSASRCDFRKKYFDDPGQIKICRRCDAA
jgi:MoaA/NifB/PqqE/SkfB family radical SAM enzyme